MKKKLEMYAKNISVIYVEDDEFLRKITKDLLSRFFKTVDTAEDGVIGLEMYKANKYDIVITDVRMPNMDGIELTKKIREINPDQEIVVASATEEKDVFMEFFNIGISSFIEKPLTMDTILSSLYKVCKNIYTVSELEKMKRKYLYDSIVVTVNHKINQVLTSLLGYLDLVLKNDDDTKLSEIREFLKKIQKSALIIADILKKLEQIDTIDLVSYIDDIDMIDIHDD